MKVSLLYTQNTPADRDIDWLVEKLDLAHVPVSKIDADSREGIALTELYEVVSRPAVLVTDMDGRLIQRWMGQLPTVPEVAAAYNS